MATYYVDFCEKAWQRPIRTHKVVLRTLSAMVTSVLAGSTYKAFILLTQLLLRLYSRCPFIKGLIRQPASPNTDTVGPSIDLQPRPTPYQPLSASMPEGSGHAHVLERACGVEIVNDLRLSCEVKLCDR